MRATGKRKAPASPRHRQPQKQRSRSVANEDESALDEIYKETTNIRFPADAHVVGEPVTVTHFLRPSGVRAGLFAVCERNGVAYEVSLADVVFAAGSAGDAFVARYRTWLGLAPPTGAAASKSRPHKVIEGDVVIGTPTDLVVLACRSNALHCRMLGGSRVVTLRTAVRDEVPGAIITVVPTKQWTHARHPYINGEITAMRFDGQALGLPLLALRDEGEWNPEDEYWGEEGEPLEPWAKAIIARGTRPMLEMEQVIPGADPEDWDSDPITDASDLRESGDVRAAYKALMDLLARDLRCLDAHAHLGNLEFDHNPRQALRHYEMGTTIGALSLGKSFDGVLPWRWSTIARSCGACTVSASRTGVSVTFASPRRRSPRCCGSTPETTRAPGSVSPRWKQASRGRKWNEPASPKRPSSVVQGEVVRPPARETPIAFSGTWRITETELWDTEALDTVQPAFIRFDDEMIGSLGMIVIQVGLDCRFGERDGKPFVELTFEGEDDGHPCSGRAWAKIESDGKLRGRIYIHLGDDSEFVAERGEGATISSPPSKKATRSKPLR